MSKLAFLFSGTGVTVGAGATLVGALAVAGYVSGAFTASPDAPDVAVETALVVEPKIEVESMEKEPEASVLAPAPEVQEVIDSPPKTPSFDVVRVETDGAAMIAGSAQAGSTVAIRLDNSVVAKVKVDRSGKFASFVTLPESKDARVLTLDTGVEQVSKERVIIAPVSAPESAPEKLVTAMNVEAIAETPKVADVAELAKAEVAAAAKIEEPLKSSQQIKTETAKDIDAAPKNEAVVEQKVQELETAEPEIASSVIVETQKVAPVQTEVVVAKTAPVESQSAPEIVETVATTAPVETPIEPQLPVVLLATDEGVRVLQSPNAPKPDAMTSLLASISYDDAGDVSLTGSGRGDFVRVYLDNRPVATTQIAASGDWQTGLPAVDTGIYTLRVDELNEAGDVVARVETPFKRETPEVLAAATKPEKLVQAVTVQPGATLWAIAQERYGSGTLYARVVAANADSIKDPNLIYPGQVFTIPD